MWLPCEGTQKDFSPSTQGYWEWTSCRLIKKKKKTLSVWQCTVSSCAAVKMATLCCIPRKMVINIFERMKIEVIFLWVQTFKYIEVLLYFLLCWAPLECHTQRCMFSSYDDWFLVNSAFNQVSFNYSYKVTIPPSLAAVDDDILWLDPFLQHALFGVFAPTPKQPRRLNLKVANALFVVVQQTEAILIHYLLIGFFQNLQQV